MGILAYGNLAKVPMGCSYLTDVYCYAKRVPTTGKSIFDNSSVSSVTLHVSATSLEMYKAKNTMEQFLGEGFVAALDNLLCQFSVCHCIKRLFAPVFFLKTCKDTDYYTK